MEYVFGHNHYAGIETLLTKGSEHTDLKGFQEVFREYEDADITDSFFVVEKSKSAEDAEGNCYDWYVIDRHNQGIQKTKHLAIRTEEVYDTTMDTQSGLLETFLAGVDTQTALIEVAMMCYEQQAKIRSLEGTLANLAGGE